MLERHGGDEVLPGVLRVGAVRFLDVVSVNVLQNTKTKGIYKFLTSVLAFSFLKRMCWTLVISVEMYVCIL